MQPKTDSYLNTAAGLGAASTAAVNPGALDISKYENPFQSDVVNATMAEIANQNRQQAQSQTSSAISAGAFGGDRAGVAQAALAGQQNLASNATLANLNSQNYAQATQTAQGQQATTLAADQANRAAAAEGAQLYAGLGGLSSSTGIANAGAQIQGGVLQQQTQQAADTAKYGQFEQQQAYPFQTAQFLAGITGSLAPELGGSTSGTQVSSPPNPFNSIIGGGLGLAAMLSDRRAKEDIRAIGKTFDGQPLYSFRYKGEPVTHIGLIAQEVEKKHPEAVERRGDDMRVVDYAEATRKAAEKGRFARGGATLGDLDMTSIRRYADGGIASMPYADGQGYVPTVGLASAHTPQAAPNFGQQPPASSTATDPGFQNLMAGTKMLMGGTGGGPGLSDKFSDFMQDATTTYADGGKVIDLGEARLRRGYDGGGVVSDPNSLLFDPTALGTPGAMQPGVGAVAPDTSFNLGNLPTVPAAPKPLAPAPSQGLGAAGPSSAGKTAGVSTASPSPDTTPVPVSAAPNPTPVLGYAGPTPGLAPADTSGSPSGGVGAIDKAAPTSPTSMDGYYGRVRALESNGGDNSAVSPAGARGVYQFMPTTWAGLIKSHPELGLTPDGIGDVKQQEAAMRAFTADNTAQLKTALGRDPTPAEIYLAHQQGAGGAIALLTNPNARAGDLVGDKAVSMNGGDPNMKASDFAGLWASKFNGAKPSSVLSYAGNGDGQGSGGGAANSSPSRFSDNFGTIVGGTGQPTADHSGGVLGLFPGMSDDARIGLAAAGFGMMASPSRSWGQAIGQGGSQGVQAYQNQKKLEADINLRVQELHAKLAEIAQKGKNYESEDRGRVAEAKARLQNADTERSKVNLERYQVIPGPDGDFRYFDKLNPGAGIQTADKVGLAPPPSAGPPSIPPTGPNTPAPLANPSPVPQPGATSAPQSLTGPSTLDSSDFMRTGNPTLRAPHGYLPTNYYQNQLRAQNDPVVRETQARQTVDDVTDANTRAKKAYSGLYYSDEMDRAISGLPKTGALAPGGFFNERLTLAKNWNAFTQLVPALSDLQVDPEAVKRGESLVKDKTRLAADLTQSLGSREAASVYSAMMSAVPGADNTRAGYKAVSSAIRTLSQREIDRNIFVQDWAARYGNTNGAEVAFNQLNPPMQYARQAEALARIPQEATDLLRNNARDSRTIAQFEKTYGTGTARYFTGQAVQ